MNEESGSVASSEHVVAQGDPSAEHGARVTIIYNGLSREVEFKARELVGEIRARAMVAFSITQNQHLLALWNEAGAELPDEKTAHDAGIRPHDKLLLRPSAVRGGGAA